MGPIVNSKVYVAPSKVSDRGVFARRDIQPDEVIEVCPLIVGKDNGAQIIEDYKFWMPNKKSAVALGYGSLYNHREMPNASWKIRPRRREMVITADEPIPKNKEIFIHYGDNWWSTRDSKPK